MDARDVELIARDAIVAAYRFESISRSVQTSTGGYKESSIAWVASSSVFDAALSEFTSAAPRLLGDEASVAAVAAIQDTWAKIREQFADLDGLYAKLKAS